MQPYGHLAIHWKERAAAKLDAYTVRQISDGMRTT
jgi:hypothetical protein